MLKIYRRNGILFSFFLIAFTLISGHAEPGNEQVIESGTIEARLFLSEIQRNNHGFVETVRVAWLPQDIQSDCFKLALEDCYILDHCKRYPDGSECKKFDPKTIRPRKIDTIPYTILEEYLIDKKTVAVCVHRWKLKHEKPGITKVDKFSRDYSIMAKIHLEYWTNGADFKVEKIENSY